MLRLYLNNTLFYSFNESENQANYIITSLKLKKEINTLSSLSFETYDNHPRYSQLMPKRSLIVLHDDTSGRTPFVGKVSSIRRNIISGVVSVECEELLGCLRDSVLVDDKFIDDISGLETEHPETFKYTYSRLIQKAITDVDYNTTVNNLPQLTSWIESDSLLNDNVNTSVLGNDRLSVLYSTVSSYTGGIFMFIANGNGSASTYTPSNLNIHYRVAMRNASRDEYGFLIVSPLPDISFNYGENIINAEVESTQEDPITAVIPYGSYKLYNGVDENPIEYKIRYGEISGSSPYVYNQNLRNKYGLITKGIDFGMDSNLYTQIAGHQELAERSLKAKADNWKNNSLKMYCDKMIITGIDYFYYNKSKSPLNRQIDLLDIIGIYIPSHTDYMYGKNTNYISYFDYCLSIEIDYFNHENDRYTIGPYIPDNLLDYRIPDVIAKSSKYPEAKMNTNFIGLGIKGIRA